ncbi:MAG: short-chain fatty acid transporter [Acidobacteria bacterium]|nr:short-chain fatty acid transporter [Acidobacteriota bacterium]
MSASPTQPRHTAPTSRSLASIGLRLSDWLERWFPDAFVLAILAAVAVFVAGTIVSGSPTRTAQSFGAGFWDLVAFTMQVALIIVTGYAVAISPPVHAVIRWMAAIPKSGRGAVAFVALFSMLSSLLSWSFSLIFSGLLAREVAGRVRGVDYRALGAAAYLGLGSVWAFGLSSSAALIMAAPASLPDSIEAISGVIPLNETLGLWQSFVVGAVVVGMSIAISYFSAPDAASARTMETMGVPPLVAPADRTTAETPGEWLEYSPILSIFVGVLGAIFLASEVATRGFAILLDLNHYVFAFLMAAVLLHWRPRSFVRAVAAALPSVGGVLVQYPIYAGIVGMMTGSGLSERLAEFFVAISSVHTFPVVVGIYSAFLGFFVPSAGGKWLIEAPYILEAAKSLNQNLGWVVQTYNATEALANLIHPFWMLPLIGILGLKARDIVGYSMLQFIVHVPVVLLLVWLLNYTF